MLLGAHAIIYTKDAGKVRRFFRDVLKLRHVDAGQGWLIFALPPAELGIHPDPKGGFTELHLMCDDVEKTMAELGKKGVRFTGPAKDYGYGIQTAIRMPDGSKLGLYQPRHRMAIRLPKKSARAKRRRGAKRV